MLDQTIAVDFAFVRPPPSRSGKKSEGRARRRSNSPGAGKAEARSDDERD